MRYLITGTAGFIGFNVARRLLADGHMVQGIDNFSSYYDVSLKEARNAILERSNAFQVERCDLEDAKAVTRVFESFLPDVVIHLAAQAGVRYSIDFPEAYISANLVGTFNVMEACRHYMPKHFLAASTSSAYGANTDMPFKETDRAVHPMTLYAATKSSTELMGHSYSHLFNIPTTFFRFFTVYGPWGRPDMALFKFAKAMMAGEPIEVFGHGQMSRDFTYIDDLVEAILRLSETPPNDSVGESDSLSPAAPFRLVNIGRGSPSNLMDYIAELEKALRLEAEKIFLPVQMGDVPATFADVTLLTELTDYTPSTPIQVGVPAFVDWYRAHYLG